MSTDNVVQGYLQAVSRGVKSEIQRHRLEMEKEWKAHKDPTVAWLLCAADYRPAGAELAGYIDHRQS